MTDTVARYKPSSRHFFLGGTALAGAFVAFSVMAADVRFRLGIPLSATALAVASAAISLAVRPDDATDVAKSTPLARLVRPLASTVASGIAFFLALSWAAAGGLGLLPAAIVVPVTFLGLVASVFHVGAVLGPWATDESGEARPLFRRHGFGVVALAAVLYLPLLGGFSLIDPWETRYGEVAREILSRGDWISIWWAQEGWEWTKPVLDFWVQALAMGALGVNVHPDEMLSRVSGGFSRPEWAVRLPSFLLATIALYLLYKAVAVWHGRRAGLLGAFVLATTSHWFFLAHQSMTDMPLVAPLSASMALVLLAMRCGSDERVRSYAITFRAHTLRVDAWHLVFALVLMTALPQILYLASRNVELQWVATPHGFRPHLDAFSAGSAGNCHLPGNERCAQLSPRFVGLQPATQALVWTVLTGILVFSRRRERRAAHIAALGAWYFAAVATMAKGPGGLVLPIGATLVYVIASGDFRKVLALEILSGVGLVAISVLPWYLAMYVRHGPPFTDQLVFVHMLQRATAHIHDTNEGDDVSFRYYVWQLGYAMFPWTGLCAAALVGWMRSPERDRRGRALPEVLFFAWFVLAFGLFASMPTKFHHYIFPAVPPAAMLTGLFVDRLWCSAHASSGGGAHERRMLGAAAVGAAVVLALVGRDLVHRRTGVDIEGQARLLHLFTYQYRRPWPDSLDFTPTLTALVVAAAGVSVLLAADRWRRWATLAMGGAALAFAVWALDVYLVRCAPHWGQRELFTAYYAERRGPDEPIIAYQMNWKGENFYTGNHVPVFVSSGQPFSSYLRAERERGRKTFYFLSEHSRTDALRSEIGPTRSFERRTDARLNNKFALVRATFD